MQRKFRRISEVSIRQKMFFFEALFFQLISGLILKLVPFRMIPEIFRLPSKLSPQSGNLISDESPLAAEIKQAIRKSNSLSPWKNKCLVQSLAARWMLNLRGLPSQLFLGVALCENGKMIAHAWLKSGDFEVVEKDGDFRELYLF